MKCPHYGAIPWGNSWPPGGGWLCWVSSVTEAAVIFPYWDRQFCEGVFLPYLFCFFGNIICGLTGALNHSTLLQVK